MSFLSEIVWLVFVAVFVCEGAAVVTITPTTAISGVSLLAFDSVNGSHSHAYLVENLEFRNNLVVTGALCGASVAIRRCTFLNSTLLVQLASVTANSVFEVVNCSFRASFDSNGIVFSNGIWTQSAVLLSRLEMALGNGFGVAVEQSTFSGASFTLRDGQVLTRSPGSAMQWNATVLRNATVVDIAGSQLLTRLPPMTSTSISSVSFLNVELREGSVLAFRNSSLLADGGGTGTAASGTALALQSVVFIGAFLLVNGSRLYAHTASGSSGEWYALRFSTCGLYNSSFVFGNASLECTGNLCTGWENTGNIFDSSSLLLRSTAVRVVGTTMCRGLRIVFSGLVGAVLRMVNSSIACAGTRAGHALIVSDSQLTRVVIASQYTQVESQCGGATNLVTLASSQLFQTYFRFLSSVLTVKSSTATVAVFNLVRVGIANTTYFLDFSFTTVTLFATATPVINCNDCSAFSLVWRCGAITSNWGVFATRASVVQFPRTTDPPVEITVVQRTCSYCDLATDCEPNTALSVQMTAPDTCQCNCSAAQLSAEERSVRCERSVAVPTFPDRTESDPRGARDATVSMLLSSTPSASRSIRSLSRSDGSPTITSQPSNLTSSLSSTLSKTSQLRSSSVSTEGGIPRPAVLSGNVGVLSTITSESVARAVVVSATVSGGILSFVANPAGAGAATRTGMIATVADCHSGVLQDPDVVQYPLSFQGWEGGAVGAHVVGVVSSSFLIAALQIGCEILFWGAPSPHSTRVVVGRIFSSLQAMCVQFYVPSVALGATLVAFHAQTTVSVVVSSLCVTVVVCIIVRCAHVVLVRVPREAKCERRPDGLRGTVKVCWSGHLE